jgi:hypothetical protein
MRHVNCVLKQQGFAPFGFFASISAEVEPTRRKSETWLAGSVDRDQPARANRGVGLASRLVWLQQERNHPEVTSSRGTLEITHGRPAHVLLGLTPIGPDSSWSKSARFSMSRLVAAVVAFLIAAPVLARGQVIIISAGTTGVDQTVNFPAGSQAPPRDTAQSAKPGTATLRGRVFAADTGQPMRRAQVRITSTAAPGKSPPHVRNRAAASGA